MEQNPAPTANPAESDEDKQWSTTREAHQAMYLEYLREGHTYLEAAAALGVARSTAYRWRQDPEYFKKCLEAQKESVPALEAVAYKRAVKGSDKLLIFLLQAKDPAKYNLAQKVEHSGQVDVASVLAAARTRSGTT